jgi:DNA invertase Pin-like site-specific DNA recombinase
MINTLVSHNTHIASSEKANRAAQYVRMSTDRQEYSTANQIDANATYAAQHGLTIVRTYEDEGRSVLRIHGRQGLKDLIADVVLGRADFDRILVYDVSRWGRFQDADESAHYEFICKQAGVRVEYCGEEFKNDGSDMSAVMKYLKRVYAGQYSRDLSNKVFAGQCRLVKLGFRQRGPPGFGLRRQLIDETGNPRGLLAHGERKYLQTDRVLLLPGPEHELAIVREAFHQCVVEQKTDTQIARALNQEGIKNRLGHTWTSQAVRYLLRNENYIGTLVYNRKTCRSGSPQRNNAPATWIRVPGVFPPIVDPDLFRRAQQIKKQRRLNLSNREMLARLESLSREKGRLSAGIIDEAEDLPNNSTYIKHFGSLNKAYELITYSPKCKFHPVDSSVVLNTHVAKFASEMISAIELRGESASFDTVRRVLTVNGKLTISVYIARCLRAEAGWLRWAVRRRINLDSKWIVALRLDLARAKVLDYLLLPVAGFPKGIVEFSYEHPARLEACRFQTIHALVPAIWQRPRIVFAPGRPRKVTETASLIRQIPKAVQAVSAKPRRPKRSRTRSRSKGASGRARH